MNIEEVKDTTDQARNYNEWFENEWNRNGVKGLIQHNDQLIANVKYLLSIIQQAEMALERAKGYLESGMHYGPAEAIDETLKAIRGN